MSGGKRLAQEPVKISKKMMLWVIPLMVAVLAVAVYGAWLLLIPEPAVAGPTQPRTSGMTAPGTAVSSDQTAEETPVVDPYERKDSYWTFLLVGIDRVGANTDSLMCVSYDVANQKVNVVSVPRDTRVDVTGRDIKKINAAYAYGKIDGLKDEMSAMLGIPIDYYVTVNIRGFVALVNAVDGIDFEVPCYMNYDDPYQDLHIHFSKGMQHLNGQQCLEVSRFRQNNDSSGYGDTGRMETQRAIISAVAKKVLSWGNITRISEFLDIVSTYVTTDLSTTDMVWFATQALSFSMENLSTMTLPCEWHNPYMYLNPAETLQMVNEYLNPYTTDRTADMLDIVTR